MKKEKDSASIKHLKLRAGKIAINAIEKADISYPEFRLIQKLNFRSEIEILEFYKKAFLASNTGFWIYSPDRKYCLAIR